MAVRLDDLLVGGDLLGHLGVLHAGGAGLGNLDLALVEGLALHLPLGLQGGDDVLVLPANLEEEELKNGTNRLSNPIMPVEIKYLVSEPAQGAEPPAVLQAENLEGGGDHHLLLAVVRGRHALEGLEPLQSGLATLGLVGRHATDGAPEDLGGRAEVEGSTAGLHVTPLLEEVEVLQLVAVEVAAHVDALAPAAVRGEGARWPGGHSVGRPGLGGFSGLQQADNKVMKHHLHISRCRYKDGKQQLGENHPSGFDRQGCNLNHRMLTTHRTESAIFH